MEVEIGVHPDGNLQDALDKLWSDEPIAGKPDVDRGIRVNVGRVEDGTIQHLSDAKIWGVGDVLNVQRKPFRNFRDHPLPLLVVWIDQPHVKIFNGLLLQASELCLKESILIHPLQLFWLASGGLLLFLEHAHELL